MKRTRTTEEALLGKLKTMTDRKSGLTKTSEELGFARSYIWQVVNGRRAPSDGLIKALGYRRVVEYERVA